MFCDIKANFGDAAYKGRAARKLQIKIKMI
jgi:hypothetical protein